MAHHEHDNDPRGDMVLGHEPIGNSRTYFYIVITLCTAWLAYILYETL